MAKIYNTLHPQGSLGDELYPNIESQNIPSGAVTESKLANGSVTQNKIGSGAITSSHIQTGAITNAKIGSNAVGSTNIQANAIIESKISNGAVTTAKINDEAVTNSKIADNEIEESKLNFTKKLWIHHVVLNGIDDNNHHFYIYLTIFTDKDININKDFLYSYLLDVTGVVDTDEFGFSCSGFNENDQNIVSIKQNEYGLVYNTGDYGSIYYVIDDNLSIVQDHKQILTIINPHI